MKIIFLRHGLTKSNTEKRFSKKETRLSDMAYKDLDKSFENLKDYKIDKVYTSALIRSQETAKYLKFNNFTIDERLNEMDFGDFKGMKVKDCYKKYADFYKKKSENPYTTKYPNGECIKDLIKRLDSFIKEKYQENKDKTILCVSHGIAIRAALFTILKDLDNFENFWLDNGSLSILNIKKDKQIIECVNKIWNL